jgi:predicted SAM-dependent methyltransferase
MKKHIQNRFSQRSYENLKTASFEFKRLTTRLFQKKQKQPDQNPNLQLGAGIRKVNGFTNVDLSGADINLDLTYKTLPWVDNCFENIVSQHLIEHLYVHDELIPLLKELHRILAPGGSIWLATPDMEKICQSYIQNKCADLVKDRENRMPWWKLGDYPSQHMMNDLFHQEGEHKNLFDYEYLEWILRKVGFATIEKSSENALIEKFPDFPKRNDELQSLYVCAQK